MVRLTYVQLKGQSPPQKTTYMISVRRDKCEVKNFLIRKKKFFSLSVLDKEKFQDLRYPNLNLFYPNLNLFVMDKPEHYYRKFEEFRYFIKKVFFGMCSSGRVTQFVYIHLL